MGSLSELIRIIERSWKPNSDIDIYVAGIALFMIFLIVTGFIKRTFKFEKYNKSLFFLCTLIPILYVITFLLYIPKLHRLDKNKIGIVITKFNGASLQDNFGTSGIEESLANQLMQNFKMLGLNEYVDINTISYIANSSETAKSILSKYDGKCVIWGNISQFDSTIILSINIHYSSWKLEIQTSEHKVNSRWFALERIGPIEINPDGKNFNKEIVAIYQ